IDRAAAPEPFRLSRGGPNDSGQGVNGIFRVLQGAQPFVAHHGGENLIDHRVSQRFFVSTIPTSMHVGTLEFKKNIVRTCAASTSIAIRSASTAKIARILWWLIAVPIAVP